MRFLKKFLISGIAFASMLLFSENIFAENYIMKIAFVGDTGLTNDIVGKIFDKKVEIADESSAFADVYGLRTLPPTADDDMVWYKFKSSPISNLEEAVSPACDMIFMVIDFSLEKDSSNDMITRSVRDIRRLSDGKKIVLIVLNADRLAKCVTEDLKAARDLYRENNFDCILSLSVQDNAVFKVSFFEATDKVVDWRKLPTLKDYNILYKLDPAGTIVSKFFGDMIGMREFKRDLKSIILRVVQDKRDKERGKTNCINPSYHMLLMGNPGTGKTTIARRMADVFYDAGIISENKFLPVERKSLVGPWIGSTEQIVEKVLKEAEGGVLFIDEAYSLAGADERDYGKHVIEGMLTSMTENRCIVIAAGYPNKMQKFLKANPGLSRRFTYRIDIPDYSEQDLFTIFKSLISRSGFKIQPAEEQRIQNLFIAYFLEQKAKLKENFGNAGSVESFFGYVLNERAVRLSLHPGILEDFITLEDVWNVIIANGRD